MEALNNAMTGTEMQNLLNGLADMRTALERPADARIATALAYLYLPNRISSEVFIFWYIDAVLYKTLDPDDLDYTGPGDPPLPGCTVYPAGGLILTPSTWYNERAALIL